VAAEEYFEKRLMEELKIPCSDESLNTTFHSIMTATIDTYNSNAVGGDKDKTREQLEKLLEIKKEAKKKENQF